jgi:hypothetical protein
MHALRTQGQCSVTKFLFSTAVAAIGANGCQIFEANARNGKPLNCTSDATWLL